MNVQRVRSRTLSRGLTLFFATLLCVDCARDVGQQGSSATPATIAQLNPAVDIEVLPLSKRSIPLGRVVAVHEAEFGRLLSYRGYAAPDPSDVRAMLSMASSANASDALGLVGKLEMATDVTDKDLVVVMENPTATSAGVYQTTRYHFASIRIAGRVAYSFKDISLHFQTEVPDEALDCSMWRGCRPTPGQLVPMTWVYSTIGGAGLPAETLIDVETNSLPQNAAGSVSQLRLFAGADVGLATANSFVCAGKTAALDCPDNQGLPVAQLEQSSLSIQNSAVVSERQFSQWLRDGKIPVGKFGKGNAAAAANAALNHPASRGIVAKAVEGSVAVDTLFVIRDPFVSLGEQRFEGSTVFIVPGPLVLPGGIIGVDPRIIFNAPLPLIPWTSGVCGPIGLTNSKFSQSWLGGYGFNTNQPNFGTNRFGSGFSRSSVRFPFKFNGAVEVEKLACSIYQPPTPPPQVICVNGFNPQTGQLIQEECNGVDDNCNGEVDELQGTVDPCGLPACSACVPVSCGSTRCSSIPDGCGSVVTCPCP